jgi:probable H4MPT-linked C1 transfer pathway protein
MSVVGIDIGGANLKVARDDGAAWSDAFALWQSPQLLAGQLMEQWADASPDVVLATMTGELCDCFATRAEGVRFIVEHLEAAADDAAVRVWSMARGFVTPAAARAAPHEVAAGNWHALAHWLAPMWSAGLTLLIDVGSTTTDIIPMRDGALATDSRTDAARLERGELVYLGAERTPIMALVDALTLDDTRYPVMAEHFATLADALVLTGDADEDPQTTDTPDGRGRGETDAARRLVRMIGSDLDACDVEAARQFARQCRDAAVERLTKAIAHVLQNTAADRVVLGGSGAVLAQRALDALHYDGQRIDLARRIGDRASHAACAHALVQLWQREH